MEVKVRLTPKFDWADEGVLFDPSGSGTPWDDVGEFAHLEITNVYWSGLSSNTINWNPIDTAKKTAKVEIKDGGFAGVWADADNDGVLSLQDYQARKDDVGSLLVVNSSEKAEYYVWIDVVGNRTIDVQFVGAGSVQYVGAYNLPNSYYYLYETNNNWWPKLDASSNLARGYVDVKGKATPSSSISSSSIQMNVWPQIIGSAPPTGDWARMTVFSVDVDMAFNHDRGNNTGTDGINIRSDGSADTKHYGPEFSQNTSQPWTTPNGSYNQGNVLYLASKTASGSNPAVDRMVTVANRFEMTPAIPGNVTLKLNAVAAVFAIAGLNETDVTFVNGVSNGSTPVSGVGGFVMFPATAKTAMEVRKEEGKFTWNVTKIAGKTTGTGKTLDTGDITIFTVLDVPKEPWDPADKTDWVPNLYFDGYITTTDNRMQPWTSVLETLTDAAWCEGMDDFLPTSTIITQNINQRFSYQDWTDAEYRKVYNVVPAAPTPPSQFSYFNLSNFHAVAKDLGGGRAGANCLDLAFGVVIFSNLLGDDLTVMNITVSGGFMTNKILPVGKNQAVASDWVEMNWGYHAVAVRSSGGDNYIYDACLMLDESAPELPVRMLWNTYRTKLTTSASVSLIANTRPIFAIR